MNLSRILRPMRFLALVLIPALVGCYETSLSLGPEDKATVSLLFCGDWEAAAENASPDQPKVKLIVRNIDGKRYFVEWIDASDKNAEGKILRMIGFTADVKGATFAHLRDMPEDGTIPEKHLVMRVELKDGKLRLQNLNENFFKDHAIDTDADFRRIVEDNLDDADMYDKDAIVAIRILK